VAGVIVDTIESAKYWYFYELCYVGKYYLCGWPILGWYTLLQ